MGLNETELMELKNGLSHFTCTEKYHKLTLLPLNCTDGVAFLAEKANAFWLIDAIASYTLDFKQPFQVWELTKVESKKPITFNWFLTMKEDSDQPNLVKQKIPYSDFPLNSIQLYLIDGVLLLPSEY